MHAAPAEIGLRRILIAEDEWIVALALRRQVQALGYEVVGTVDTGTKVVEACRDDGPDVVLMDLQMPEMDGLEATRRLMETCPHPVIVVTGHADLREQAEEAGAMEFIVKPLMQQQLPAILARVQRRFARYLQVHAQSASCGEALECWLAVWHAARRLEQREGLEEEEAFARLQARAEAAGRTLYEEAKEVLGGGDTASADELG